MANVNDKMIEQTAKDYAAYLKLDLSSQTKGVHESVDDMLIRLEEFESIVGMVQNVRAECTYEHLVRFRSAYPELMELCKRIDALEVVVARASNDLGKLEIAVEQAESQLGIAPASAAVSDRLLGILNPLSLFKPKIPEAAPQPSTSSPRRPDPPSMPDIYKTEEAFNTNQ